MSDHYKTIVRDVHAALSRQDLDTAAEHMTSDQVDHGAPPDLQNMRGGELLRAVMEMYYQAFPDLNIETLDLIAEGNMVATRVRATGTHEGEFMGIPPTGREVSTEMRELLRFEGDQIAERWAQQDMMGLMTQIGAMEPPG